MYPALSLRLNSRAVLNNIRNYGLKRLLPTQNSGTISLATQRNCLIPRQLSLTFGSPRIPSYSYPGNALRLFTIPPQRRLFHVTRPKEMFSSFGGGRPPFKIYRISPIMALFAGVGFFVLAFAIIPFVFTFFLPIFIGTVVIIQFNKWRRNVMMREIVTSLKRSTMHVNYRTVRALHIKSLENVLKAEQQNSDAFKDVLKRFDSALGSQLDHSSAADADRLLGFINERLLEAIEKDEGGVRSYFLGNDVDSWVKDNYELELDPNQIRTKGRVLGQEALIVLSFPLYLKSSTHPRKHLANVLFVVSSKSLRGSLNAPFPFQGLPTGNEECQMVLSIRPTSVISTRQFILTTAGRSGDWYSKYDVRETSDNHTEYTIRHTD